MGCGCQFDDRRVRAGAAGAPLILVGLFLIALPLSTAAQEVALAMGLVAALGSPRRRALVDLPWGPPAIAFAACWVLTSFASGDLREGLGHAWLLAPLLVIPALATPAAAGRLVDLGLWAATLAALWAILQAAGGFAAHAGFSHHLSLAYALLPPVGVAAAAGRPVLATVLSLGVLATGSEGAAVALVATLAGARVLRPAVAMAGGVALTLALLATVADPEELRQRAVLWSGGLALATRGAVGPGAYATASLAEYEKISPGFWFQNHAHDAAVQTLAVLGPVGVVALVWLCGSALGRGARGAAAGLAGVIVGGLTQDVFGDLEVARAAWAWLALTAISGNPAGAPDTERG